MSSPLPPAQALDDDLVQFLRGVDSPTLANAIERLELRPLTEGFLDGRIACQFPELGVMLGRAVTVTMTNARGADPDHSRFWEMFAAVEAMPPPSVLVVADASGEPTRVAYAGDMMSALAQRLGAVGLVTDGGLRDLSQVRALGFHYFMRYAVVSHADFEIASVGEPVVLGGQRVATGDLLHGDENGVVIVPDAALDGLRAQVQAVLEEEEHDRTLMRADDFTLESYRRAHVPR